MADPATTEGRTAPKRRPRMWVRVLLILSIVLMVAGVALPLLMGRPEPSPAAADAPLAHGVTSFAGELGDAARGNSVSSSPSWTPAVFRLGFSFFAGFAIATAMRWAFKTAILAAGFMLLFLFGLQYAGIIDVRWGAVEQQYDSFSGWLTGQVESFQAFITGYLPSAAAAGAGAVAGVWKR